MAASSIYPCPLDPGRREIRVLTVHPGDPNDDIVCDLRTISLDTGGCDTFNALSYVWGDAQQRQPITLDGVPTTVTANLAVALRSFRSRSPSPNLSREVLDLPLWVDAVCINQQDMEERSQQVRMMRDIYSAAERVLIWLGEGDEQTDWAIGQLNGDGDDQDEGGTKTSAFFRSIMELGPVNLANARQLTRDQIRVSLVMALNINRRHWWSRIWVLQELVLASRDPVMMCGASDILWSTYSECMCNSTLMALCTTYPLIYRDEWLSIRTEVIQYPFLCTSIFTWQRTRQKFHDTGPLRLAEIFPELIMCAATNDRDLVYGTLGLSDPVSSSEIPVDYTKPAMAVFRDVAALLWTSDDPNTLAETIPKFAFAPRRRSASDRETYPSWVPDFAVQNMEETEFFTATGLLGESPWMAPKVLKSSLDDSVLEIRGVKMDWISSACYVPNFDVSEVQKFEGILEPGFLQYLEKEILTARELHIPESSGLLALAEFRSKETIPDMLGYWMDTDKDHVEDMDRELLWDVLLGRRQGVALNQDTAKQGCPDVGDDEDGSTMKREDLLPLVQRLSRRIGGRKVFVTRLGFTGVGTATLEEGDLLVLPFGAGGFYILRPSCTDEERYQMVGFAYVSGLMDWDGIDKAYRRGLIEETVFRVY